MKKDEVEVGRTYLAKVSGALAQVRITGESRYGGWDGVNVATRRQVRVKSAQRLRAEVRPRAKVLPSERLGVPPTTPDVDVKIAAAEAAAKNEEEGAMKKQTIEVGKEYYWKRGRMNWIVRVLGENAEGGYDVEIRTTHRKVRVLDAGALRPLKAETPAKKKARAKKAAKEPKEKGPKKPSGLDAAVQVLAKAQKPLSAKEMVERMLEQNLWKSDGKTPDATIYAAIIREIAAKGTEARFRKVERGRFELVAR